jgi:DNA-binding transcriptional ArsR family regulator
MLPPATVIAVDATDATASVATYVSIRLNNPVEEAIRAIAEPNRRRILKLVSEGELSAGEIASGFDITRPAVSQHLSVLRAAGLVSERRDGTRRLYSLRPEGFADLKSFLEAFWDDNLERLKEAAEREEGRRRRGRRAA